MKPSISKEMEELARKKEKVTVLVRGEREVTGRVLAIDKYMNILLKSSTERRTQKESTTKGRKRQQEKVFTREVGNIFIRGGAVIMVKVEEKADKAEEKETEEAEENEEKESERVEK